MAAFPICFAPTDLLRFDDLGFSCYCLVFGEGARSSGYLCACDDGKILHKRKDDFPVRCHVARRVTHAAAQPHAQAFQLRPNPQLISLASSTMRHLTIFATLLATAGIAAAKPCVGQACRRTSCAQALQAAHVEDLTSDAYHDCAEAQVIFVTTTTTATETSFSDAP